ncbi:hypothetical protein ACFVTC_11980 [Streptomyces sp. NPDC057950]|uniref:F0F1 ATP synthase subunit B family protein n=1 Tax=Streptomyces sp. NPDC057950 TaxID=3346288 RepID=UPI0036E467FE
MNGYITAMDLIPYPIGPLNPKVQDLLLALPLFALVYVLIARILPRMNRVLAARDDAINGTRERADAVQARAERERAQTEALLAEARHDAARIRQDAHERGAILITEAREDGQRARESVIAEGRARIESERAAAEVELRISVSELASALASRIVGERIGSPAQHRN